MIPEKRKPRIFIAYSHDHRNHADALKARLEPNSYVSFDSDIEHGENFRLQVREEMAAADLIVLLVSQAFGDSDYCPEEADYARLLKQERGVKVVPVRVDKGWADTNFKDIKSLPDGDATLSAPRGNLDNLYDQVCSSILTLTPSEPVWNIEESLPFFGRQELLLKLGSQSAPLALTGLEGIGKASAVKMVASQGQFHLGWRIRGDSFQDDLRMLGIKLGLPVREAGRLDKVFNELKKRNDWILCFENSDKPESLEPDLPKSGLVFITSRFRGNSSGLNYQDMQPLDSEQAVALFGHYCSLYERADIERIVARMGFLPKR